MTNIPTFSLSPEIKTEQDARTDKRNRCIYLLKESSVPLGLHGSQSPNSENVIFHGRIHTATGKHVKNLYCSIQSAKWLARRRKISATSLPDDTYKPGCFSKWSNNSDYHVYNNNKCVLTKRQIYIYIELVYSKIILSGCILSNIDFTSWFKLCFSLYNETITISSKDYANSMKVFWNWPGMQSLCRWEASPKTTLI